MRDNDNFGLPSDVRTRERGNPGRSGAEDGDETDFGNIDWASVVATVWEWRKFYCLYFVILALCVVFWLPLYILETPTYTATAIIGPPAASPAGAMQSAFGGAVGGLASRVLGGGASDTSSPYREFMQLLPSPRLSKALVERDGFAQRLFWQSWDTQAKAWRTPSSLQQTIWAVKRILKRPTNYPPDIEAVSTFLDKHIEIKRASSGSTLSLIPEASSFREISFSYNDPKQAEEILGTILSETDNIIREDERKNVQSRINYLRQQLAQETMSADERSALISVLSSQEQMLTMIQADNRYASALVVAPFASRIPVSPPGPTKVAVLMAAVAFILWIALMIAKEKNDALRRLVTYFGPRTKAEDDIP